MPTPTRPSASRAARAPAASSSPPRSGPASRDTDRADLRTTAAARPRHVPPKGGNYKVQRKDRPSHPTRGPIPRQRAADAFAQIDRRAIAELGARLRDVEGAALGE